MNKLFSLEGRVALVTGGSRGIGRMIAEGFLRHGAKVYISARKAEACDRTAAELSAIGPCISLPADVSTVAGAEGLAATLTAREPKLDILVNNAGAAWGAPFDDFPESGWDKVVDLNLKSPFFLTRALHGALKAAGSAERPAKYPPIKFGDYALWFAAQRYEHMQKVQTPAEADVAPGERATARWKS